MQHIMLRRIFKGLFIIILSCFSLSFIQAADTQLDYESTKSKVQGVQTINPNLPIISGQDPKGSIGYIISKMFDSNGKIGNWFLKMLGTRSDGAVLRWSGGDEGQLVQGSIFDNGTNVGIGSVSPGIKFNVDGYIQSDNIRITSNAPKIIFTETGVTGSGAYWRQVLDGNGLRFDLSNNSSISPYTTPLMLKGNGNVGIGNSGPSYKLDVTGDINLTGDIRKNGTILNLVGKFQDGATTGEVYYNGGNVGIGTNDPEGKLHIQTGGSDFKFGTYNLVINTNTSGGWARNLAFSSNGSERGHLGALGSNNTLSFLYLDARGIETNSYSNAQFVLRPSGNVGIGTTNPSHKLDIAGTYGFNGKSVIYGNANDVYMNARVLQNTSSTLMDGMYINYNSSNSLNNSVKFYTAGIVERMRINNEGNVGVGTNSPASKLHVNGTIRTSGGSSDFVFEDTTVGHSNYLIHNNSDRLYFMHDANENMAWDDGADDRIVMYGAGDGVRLGIGTETATQKLDVRGNVIISGGLMRTTHRVGGFIGSYNNVGANSSKTNPIYSIGSNYLPNDSTLGNHYGIGYSHASNSSFIPGSGGWGMYVAADGDARIFLDGSTGKVRASGYCDINGGNCITPTTNHSYGGAYSRGSSGGCISKNPITGSCSCPSGYSNQLLASGISGSEQYINMCWK